MPAVGDVVELTDGSVGVISEALPSARSASEWRVWFPENHRVAATEEIVQTLSAPSYGVGDAVTVWPWAGTIQSISGDQVTVQLERSRRIEGVGHIQWEPDVTVPLWRIIRDNDTRLERIW